MTVNIIKHVISVGPTNIRSALHTIPAEGEDPKLCIFVCPGNPGLIDFYHEYMKTLYETSNKRIEVCGLSLAGHAPGLDNQNRVFDLRDQIDHKYQYLVEKLKKSPHMKLVLVGHSVGSYILLHTLDRLPAAQIAGYWGLYPTLQHIGASPGGQRLSPLFQYSTLAGFCASWLAYLPLSVMRTIVRPFVQSGQDYQVDAVCRLVSKGTVTNSISLAHQEMQNILDIDERIIQTHGEKMVFYFTDGDKWAPIAHYKDMVERFPDSKVFLCENNTHHGFVVFDGESKYVAKLGHEWLQEYM
eukprot:CFRG4283T1